MRRSSLEPSPTKYCIIQYRNFKFCSETILNYVFINNQTRCNAENALNQLRSDNIVLRMSETY